MIITTPVGALFTGSVMMHVSTTSAIALAVGSLIEIPPSKHCKPPCWRSWWA